MEAVDSIYLSFGRCEPLGCGICDRSSHQYNIHTLGSQVPKCEVLKSSSVLNNWSLGALWGARDTYTCNCAATLVTTTILRSEFPYTNVGCQSWTAGTSITRPVPLKLQIAQSRSYLFFVYFWLRCRYCVHCLVPKCRYYLHIGSPRVRSHHKLGPSYRRGAVTASSARTSLGAEEPELSGVLDRSCRAIEGP